MIFKLFSAHLFSIFLSHNCDCLSVLILFKYHQDIVHIRETLGVIVYKLLTLTLNNVTERILPCETLIFIQASQKMLGLLLI